MKMDRGTDNELLAAVLAEGAPPDFRAAALAQTLRAARQRRRWRRARQTGGVLLTAILAGGFAWQWLRSSPAAKVSAPSATAILPAVKNYQLVETRPLPASAQVATGEFARVKVISSVAAVTQVATLSGGFRVINDEQLLALLGSRPAILIRTGPHSEELVFVNPEDQKGFPAN
jgi:hypothetical protein